jgi:hypothetical protein
MARFERAHRGSNPLRSTKFASDVSVGLLLLIKGRPSGHILTRLIPCIDFVSAVSSELLLMVKNPFGPAHNRNRGTGGSNPLSLNA